MDLDYKAIGKRIRMFRKDMGISQVELSFHADIEASYMSNIERGRTKTSLQTLVNIANSLSVSLDDLVYDSIEHNRHVSVVELNELLSDCTNEEVAAIVETVRFMKGILRKNARHVQ